MSNDLALRQPPISPATLEGVVVNGDLKNLSAAQRLEYYGKVCESIGLNPLTRPFEYISLNNKLTLYAKRDATDQLRRIYSVSVSIVDRERVDDVYVVRARATMGHRTDESIGAVGVAGLKGDALANALMKCETKAKRRVTLSICGLGWLDETEVETIPGARLGEDDGQRGFGIVDVSQGKTPRQIAAPNTLDLGALRQWREAEGLSPEDVLHYLGVRKLSDWVTAHPTATLEDVQNKVRDAQLLEAEAEDKGDLPEMFATTTETEEDKT